MALNTPTAARVGAHSGDSSDTVKRVKHTLEGTGGEDVALAARLPAVNDYLDRFRSLAVPPAPHNPQALERLILPVSK